MTDLFANVYTSFQIAAQTLVNEKDYGLAVSYCTSAEDWPGLGRVVDRVLEEYIISGKNLGRMPVSWSDKVHQVRPAFHSMRWQSHHLYKNFEINLSPKVSLYID
jgi:hypothetical protein